MFARTVLVCARRLTVGLAVLALVQPAMADEEKSKSEERSPAAIEEALQKKIEVEFSETPLTAVVQKFQALLDVPVLLDKKALEEVGIAGDASVNGEIADVTAASALQLILRPLDLVAMPCDELILITTPDREAENLVTRVYNVSDLMLVEAPQVCDEKPEPRPATEGESSSSGKKKTEDTADGRRPGGIGSGIPCNFLRGEDSFDGLIDTITSTVEPTTWDDVGGPGSIAPLELGKTKTLIISQTPAIQQRIARLLAGLRQIQEDGSIQSVEVASDAQQESSAAIREKLAQAVDVDFQEKPLGEVVAWFEDQLGVPVQIDHKAIEEVGIARDAPVTFTLEGVSGRTALEQILRALDLTWIASSEAILVTTPDRAAENLQIRIYAVADMCKHSSESEQPAYDFDSLIEAITASVEPTTWDEVGGPGSISPYPGPDLAVLVISQTRESHDKIEALLTRLREVAEEQDDR